MIYLDLEIIVWRLINVFQPKYVVTLSKSLLENLQILFIIILPSTLLTLMAVLYKDHYLPYLCKKKMIVKTKFLKNQFKHVRDNFTYSTTTQGISMKI